MDITEEVEKAVSENPTVSSFDLEHDKPKSGKDEPESVIYYDNVPTITNNVDVDIRKRKLFGILELIEMEPKEALKILVECSY